MLLTPRALRVCTITLGLADAAARTRSTTLRDNFSSEIGRENIVACVWCGSQSLGWQCVKHPVRHQPIHSVQCERHETKEDHHQVHWK
jgi:hypothetical protein